MNIQDKSEFQVPHFNVTRAHLKTACDEQNWDLLDRLLELDASLINDNSMYTDTWGDWWGMLLQVVNEGKADGVRVLLKHGAQRDLASWGDPGGFSPLESAKEKPDLLALLDGSVPPLYTRKSDPPLPEGESFSEAGVNQQGEIRDATGIVFPAAAIGTPPRDPQSSEVKEE